MKKLLALAGVVGSPLLLALPSVLPKVAVLLLLFFPAGFNTILLLTLPLLVIGILGFAGQTVSESLLFIL
ncbi:MAG: hypothetical protein RMM98_02780 [Acidobacteriota bacterium]|nr:hypothetical protein [Blastocatellia bacterium]MDW8238516.1 hypothetical protein [Acidobacteriota bacterium]